MFQTQKQSIKSVLVGLFCFVLFYDLVVVRRERKETKDNEKAEEFI
jgi:hypothetical protein